MVLVDLHPPVTVAELLLEVFAHPDRMIMVHQGTAFKIDPPSRFNDLIAQVIVLTTGRTVRRIETAHRVKDVLFDAKVIAAKRIRMVRHQMIVAPKDLLADTTRQQVLRVGDAVRSGNDTHLLLGKTGHQSRNPVLMRDAVRIREGQEFPQGQTGPVIAGTGRAGIVLAHVFYRRK